MTEPVVAYNTEAKRITYEDVGDEFGFRLRWEVQDHWADVRAYEVVAIGAEGKLYQRKDSSFSPDPVESLDEAEVYLEGYIKWDGCSELDMGCPHWCGPGDWQKHIKLLEHIWRTAFELMGKPLPSQWACPIETMDRPKTGSHEEHST